MRVTREDAHRWLLGFDEADRADRDAKRRQGPRPAWSIAVALSLIRAARIAGGGRIVADPRRIDSDEAVRQVWDRLRSAYLH